MGVTGTLRLQIPGVASKIWKFESFHQKYQQRHKVEITMKYVSREFPFICAKILTNAPRSLHPPLHMLPTNLSS